MNLKDSEVGLEYELIDVETGNIINAKDVVAIFSKVNKKSKKIYVNIKESPLYAGEYIGKINFLIELEE